MVTEVVIIMVQLHQVVAEMKKTCTVHGDMILMTEVDMKNFHSILMVLYISISGILNGDLTVSVEHMK